MTEIYCFLNCKHRNNKPEFTGKNGTKFYKCNLEIIMFNTHWTVTNNQTDEKNICSCSGYEEIETENI